MGLVRTSKGHLYSWGYGRGVDGNIEQSLNPISVMLTSGVVPDELTAGNYELIHCVLVLIFFLGINTLGVISNDTALLWGRGSADKPLIINNHDQISIGFDDVPFSRFMVESIEPEVFEPEICKPKAEVDDDTAPDRDIELIQMASELEALRAEKLNLEEKIYKFHEANEKTQENSERRLNDNETGSVEQVTVTKSQKPKVPNPNEKAGILNNTQILNECVQNKSEDTLINLTPYATFNKREFNQFNKRLVNKSKSGYLGKNYDPNYKKKITNPASRKVGYKTYDKTYSFIKKPQEVATKWGYTKQDSYRVGYLGKNYDPNYKSRWQQPVSTKTEIKGIGYQGKNYDPNYAARWKTNESKKVESDVNRYRYLGKNFDPNYAARIQKPVSTKPEVKRVGYVGKNYDPNYASRWKKIDPDNSELKE